MRLVGELAAAAGTEQDGLGEEGARTEEDGEEGARTEEQDDDVAKESTDEEVADGAKGSARKAAASRRSPSPGAGPCEEGTTTDERAIVGASLVSAEVKVSWRRERRVAVS